MFDNVICLVLKDSDTDLENVSLILRSVSDDQKTYSSKGVSLIHIGIQKGGYQHFWEIICLPRIKFCSLTVASFTVEAIFFSRLLHRRRKRGGGGGGGGQGGPATPPPPPNNLGGGPTYPLAPIIHPPFPSISMRNRKNHKCTKLKGKIIINVTLI